MPRVLPVNGLAAFLPSAEAAAEVVDTTSDFDSAFAPATAPPR